MSDLDHGARQTLDLYRAEVRPLLEEHKLTTLEGLDQAAKVLESALARDPRVDAGFLGESQVGKSTLINAVLGQKALPSGGVGPLTAQATRIRFDKGNRVKVAYHPKKRLHQLAFAIERYLERRGELPRLQRGAAPVEAPAEALSEDELVDATLAVETISETGEVVAQSSVGDYMLSQARLMLVENEDASRRSSNVALLDGICAILGRAPRGNAADIEPLKGRIDEIRRKLGQTEEFSEAEAGGRRAFRQRLQLSAAGWAAPLVANLWLGLDAPVLDNLNLVDLPGVGVVGDPAGKIAEEFVLTEADALVVVATNKGLSEAIAQLLEKTNVITKLLFGGRDGVAPIHVIVVITHLDDVAKDRYEQALKNAEDSDDPLPDRHEIFQRLAEQMSLTVRRQIGDALRTSSAFDGLPDNVRARREIIVAELCEKMDVVCVAAPDYLRSVEGVGQLAFLQDRAATNVPRFIESLRTLGKDAIERREAGIRDAHASFREMVVEHVQSIGRMYEEGGGRATADWDRFRADLEEAARPLREQMQAHHGELLALLSGTIPERLLRLCDKAAAVSKDKLRRLRRHGETLHYQSLNAALKRDGRYERRDIDYPDTLTHALVDVIAAEWEPTVVDTVRKTVEQLASRDLKLVERLCDFALTRDDRIVADAQVDAQKRILQQQARTCVAWTREQLDQLRDDIAGKLKTEIAKPIEKACQNARSVGLNAGGGAKKRILEVFEDGGMLAIDKARERAGSILGTHYGVLIRGLEEGFLAQHHDPLRAALDALTNEELVRARRSDAQRRRRMLDRTGDLARRLSA